MIQCCNCCPLVMRRISKKIVLLLVGLDNAGKTTAARKLAGGNTEDVIPTVGFSSVKLKYRGMDVYIYDLGGGSQIRAIWKSYFSDVHGVIFVVDASDASRLEECKHILENMLRNERLAGKPVLVLANKQDKPGALDQMDLVESLRLEPLVNEQKCLTLIEECSTYSYTQRQKIDPRLLHGYRWLVNQVATEYEALNARVERDKKIDAELFEARRNELRERIGRQDKNGNGGVSYLNVESNELPYKTNIIQVSPPPGLEVSPPKVEEVESEVQRLTRHVREQLERQSIKERHKKSLTKNNKILPTTPKNVITSNGGVLRPKSEPRKLNIFDMTSPLLMEGSVKLTLAPLQSNGLHRPPTSRSLGYEGRAWGLDKELDIVIPAKPDKIELAEVRSFNDIHPV